MIEQKWHDTNSNHEKPGVEKTMADAESRRAFNKNGWSNSPAHILKGAPGTSLAMNNMGRQPFFSLYKESSITHMIYSVIRFIPLLNWRKELFSYFYPSFQITLET